MLNKILNWYNNLGLSAKINGWCAAFFITLIIIINIVLWFSLSYALYHPVEATIKYSIQDVQDFLNETPQALEKPHSAFFHERLVSGVVLRIVDEHGNVVVNTNVKNYPPSNIIEENILENPPFFFNSEFDIARLRNAIVCRATIPYTQDGKNYIMYFFRTITSAADIFDNLTKFMLMIDVFSILFAFFAVSTVSKKILTPIKNLTELARKIAFEPKNENINERIPLTQANDELTEMAKTFNMMLDRIQGDFSSIHNDFEGMQNVLSSVQEDLSKQKKFVSDVSHELKTPLTIIDWYIDILDKHGQNAEKKALREESIEAIRDETQNLKSMLENLRFIARSEQNTLKFDKEVVNLNDIIDKVFRRMKVFDKNHKLTLTKNDSAQIYADESTIVQMLRIFLDNAKKYTPNGGSIQLSAKVEKKFVEVKIKDSGIGMASENLDKIFERGVRLEDSRGGRVDGFGIGLSIAKMIADNHDIKIEVESTIGEGTTFTMKMPLVQK